MVLSEKDLDKFRLTHTQKEVIMERFGTEPIPYEWSEQDIEVQIRNYLSHGVFVKES